MTVQEWVDGYARAWSERDPDGAAALFTEDCTYLDHPTAEPHRGQEGVRSYWANVTSTQERPNVRMGEPIVSADGRRAAVEFWVRMLNSGAEVSVIGILFLRFAADGRCEELREAWHFEPADHAPPAIWGR
jgi:ketosteroid isomerase-like protein